MDGRGAKNLTGARLQTHHVAQWLARFARSYLPPKNDDSHTALGWDAGAKAFTSAPGPKGGFGLEVATLALFGVAPNGTRLGAVPVGGKTDAAVGDAFNQLLARAGYDAAAFKHDLPYEIPAHAVAAGAPYNPAAVRDDLETLAALFNEAHRLLSALTARNPGASPVRTWPHHFDMASLMTIPGKPNASVNAGFSPGDDHYAEPYYYISPYPYPPSSRLKPNPAYHWHTENFTAAIIPFAKWPKEGRRAFLASGLAEAEAASKSLLA